MVNTEHPIVLPENILYMIQCSCLQVSANPTLLHCHVSHGRFTLQCIITERPTVPPVS